VLLAILLAVGMLLGCSDVAFRGFKEGVESARAAEFSGLEFPAERCIPLAIRKIAVLDKPINIEFEKSPLNAIGIFPIHWYFGDGEKRQLGSWGKDQIKIVKALIIRERFQFLIALAGAASTEGDFLNSSNRPADIFQYGPKVLLAAPLGVESDTFNNDPGAFKVLCGLDLVTDNDAHKAREGCGGSSENDADSFGRKHESLFAILSLVLLILGMGLGALCGMLLIRGRVFLFCVSITLTVAIISYSIYYIQKLFDLPNVVANPSLHSGCNAKGLVNSAEIIPSEIKSQHSVKFLPLFRESIGQAGESAHLHSHGQVLALDMRGADVFRVGVSEHGNLFASNTIGGRIADFTLSAPGIQLDQLCEVNALDPKTKDHRILIGLEPVRGDLETALCSRSQLFRECHGVSLRAPSKVPCQNELAVALNGNKCPRIPDRGFISTLLNLGLFLHSYIAPQFIALYILDPQPMNAVIHQSLASLASQGQETQNRLWMDAGDSGSGTDRAAFNQVLQDADGLSLGQEHVAKRLGLRLDEGYLAGCTAIPLVPLPVFPELVGGLVAGWAVHFVSPRLTTQQYNIAQALSRTILCWSKKYSLGGIQ
jgi:hypothetical protein